PSTTLFRSRFIFAGLRGHEWPLFHFGLRGRKWPHFHFKWPLLHFKLPLLQFGLILLGAVFALSVTPGTAAAAPPEKAATKFAAHAIAANSAADAADTTASEPGTALTIYNQNFFVAREHVPLDLKAGVNEAQYVGVAAHLEPDSVILRDPSGRALQILEQNYRNDPVTQELLLSF